MDEQLLATKSVKPRTMQAGFVDGYELHIGERATLLRRPGSRAYGIVMEIAPGKVDALYAEKSVADYLPEQVIVELMDGTRIEATCYNLPADKLTGTNKKYAKALLDLASRLGFPDVYLQEIRRAQS